MWPVPPGYRNTPAYFNLVDDVLDEAIARFGVEAQDAIRFEGGAITYGQLRERVLALAAGLAQTGVLAGQHVLLRGTNSPEYAISFLALTHLGALPVLVHSLLAAAEVKYILDNADVGWVLVGAESAAAVRTAAREHGSSTPLIVWGGETEANELAWSAIAEKQAPAVARHRSQNTDAAFFVYSSGSTGRPKGIVHAHRWIAALGDQVRLRSGDLPPGLVSLSVGELSSISALGHGLLFPLRNGGVAAFINGRALPERVLAAIARYRVNLFFATPTLYRMLLALDAAQIKPFDLSSLNLVNSGGEPAGEALKLAWEARFPGEFHEYFAISEVQMLIANGPGLPYRKNSVGRAFPGSRLTVLNDDLEPAAADEVGYLAVPADDPGLFIDYYKRADIRRKSFRGDWYFSGDLFRRDAEGYFWFEGRADDVFKSRGYSISPIEIEAALLKHASVYEAVIIPLPDPTIGNSIKAVVVPHKSIEPSEQLKDNLIAHLRGILAPYKIPRDIEFRDDLPRHGAVTKISRRVLSDQANSNRENQ